MYWNMKNVSIIKIEIEDLAYHVLLGTTFLLLQGPNLKENETIIVKN